MTAKELFSTLKMYEPAYPMIMDMEISVTVKTPKKRKELICKVTGVSMDMKYPLLQTDEVKHVKGIWL